MSYCTLAEVKAEFKDLKIEDTGTSIVTSEAEDFIEQTGGYIDAYISRTYVTPVTAGDGAIAVLKMINIFLAAQRIKDILRVKTGDEKVNQEFGTNLWKKGEDMLKRIVSKDLLLDGATLLSSSGGVKSYTADNNIKPVFKKATRQW